MAKQAAKKKIKQKDQAKPTSVEPKDPFKYKASDSVNILNESYSSNTESDDEDFCELYSEAEDNASQESYMDEGSQDVIDQQELEDLAQDDKDHPKGWKGQTTISQKGRCINKVTLLQEVWVGRTRIIVLNP